nr:uncharacterized protein LOC110370168 isoform X1 [Helicoverpa armigera]
MQWHTTEDGKYRIESLSAAKFPGALKVLKDYFLKDEAVCIGTAVDQDPLAQEELLELCADAALDGLSVVAVDNDSGEVVSVVFNKLQEKPSETSGKTFFEIFTEERCKRPSSREMMDFMVDLDARCNFFERYGVDCCSELMFLGTHRAHRQKGLAKLVCKTSMELAKKLKDGPVAPMTIEDLGPKYSFMKPRKPVKKPPQLCHALWSAVGSKKVGQDLGFEVIIDVPLKEFVFDGKPYSERIGAETTCEGAAIRIDK